MIPVGGSGPRTCPNGEGKPSVDCNVYPDLLVLAPLWYRIYMSSNITSAQVGCQPISHISPQPIIHKLGPEPISNTLDHFNPCRTLIRLFTSLGPNFTLKCSSLPTQTDLLEEHFHPKL